jgi:hypothetical protein
LCRQCERRRTENSQKKQRHKNLAATTHEPLAGSLFQRALQTSVNKIRGGHLELCPRHPEPEAKDLFY